MLRMSLVQALVRVGELGRVMRIRLDLREIPLGAEAICLFLSLNQLLNQRHKGMEMFCASGSGVSGKF